MRIIEIYISKNRIRKTPVLTEMMVSYADEMITDEQIDRILAPVFMMIRTGIFDRPELDQRSELTPGGAI